MTTIEMKSLRFNFCGPHGMGAHVVKMNVNTNAVDIRSNNLWDALRGAPEAHFTRRLGGMIRPRRLQ